MVTWYCPGGLPLSKSHGSWAVFMFALSSYNLTEFKRYTWPCRLISYRFICMSLLRSCLSWQKSTQKIAKLTHAGRLFFFFFVFVDHGAGIRRATYLCLDFAFASIYTVCTHYWGRATQHLQQLVVQLVMTASSIRILYWWLRYSIICWILYVSRTGKCTFITNIIMSITLNL